MNTSTLSLRGPRRLFSGLSISSVLLALVLVAGLAPATAHAQGRFGGRAFGPAFGRGLGWGLGLGIGSALIYDTVGYYSPRVVYTAAPATVYYVPQPAPQTVVVNSTPAPVAPAAPPAPAVSTGGKMSKIVYDANGKPMGVLILNPDGRQEFVPLAQ